jgi:hypothetical protein
MNRIVFLGQGSGGARTDPAQADLAVAALLWATNISHDIDPESHGIRINQPRIKLLFRRSASRNLPESLF